MGKILSLIAIEQGFLILFELVAPDLYLIKIHAFSLSGTSANLLTSKPCQVSFGDTLIWDYEFRYTYSSWKLCYTLISSSAAVLSSLDKVEDRQKVYKSHSKVVVFF